MRKLLAATLSLLLAGAMLVTVTSPAQAAKKKFSLTIAASATTITKGDHFTISGRIKPAVAGKAIVIKKKLAGKSWYGTTKVYTAADGSYTFDAAPPQLGKIYYRVYTAKKGKYRANYSRTISVTVKAAVQQNASVTITGTGNTNITAGDSFVVKGTASANLIGKTVVLETQDSGGWSDLATATVAADATFNVTAPANLAGAGQVVRVYAPATGSTYYAESGTATFNVYGWYYLSERTDLDNTSSWYADDVTVNGTYYPKSMVDYLWYDDIESVQFDLGRKCIRFRAVAGWTDSSNSAVSGTASVYKDAVKVWGASAMKLGTGIPVDVDVSGSLRLKLEAVRSGGSRSAFAFGDAKILCAF